VAVRGRRNAEAVLAAALASGQTVEQAARQAQISERTAYRRLAEPGFQERLASVRAETLGQLVCAITAVGRLGVSTLAQLQSPTEPSSIRLSEARAALELGVRLREAEQLEKRVSELEQQLGQPSDERFGTWPPAA
jgi:hypothetical protein